MKKTLAFLSILLLGSSLFAQDNFLVGEWKFEQIPDYVEMDEQGREMAEKFLREMTVSFDEKNYSQSIMGQTDDGTYVSAGGDAYTFKSSRGVKFEVEIKKISENQIIFKQRHQELQLIKSAAEANIEKSENRLDAIAGEEIESEKLLGQWFYNGRIKDGEHSDLILKHSEDEVVNYTFMEDGTYINKAPLGIDIEAKWMLEDDNQTISIESEEMTESLKVVKLSKKELHLYNPKNDSVLKFKR